jgi:HNH endonuclease
MEQSQLYNNIRNGRLPSISTNRMLEGGEICHVEFSCTYVWKKRRKRQGETTIVDEEAKGDVTITSNRILFNSDGYSFEFRPSKIVDISKKADTVEIKTSINKGSGLYYVDDAKYIEAILFGLVSSHNFQTENLSSERTRHISSLVKRKTWAKDGGKCVYCSAKEYLEYDHIIPFSKGGSNSENNIQLLCRNCNLAKSDRI